MMTRALTGSRVLLAFTCLSELLERIGVGVGKREAIFHNMSFN